MDARRTGATSSNRTQRLLLAQIAPTYMEQATGDRGQAIEVRDLMRGPDEAASLHKSTWYQRSSYLRDKRTAASQM